MTKLDLEILTDLDVFSAPEYEEVAYGLPLLCLYVCLYMRLASA
jgi:hypothetical protein